MRPLGSAKSFRSICFRLLLFMVTFVSDLIGTLYLLPPSTLSLVVTLLTIFIQVVCHLLAWTGFFPYLLLLRHYHRCYHYHCRY